MNDVFLNTIMYNLYIMTSIYKIFVFTFVILLFAYSAQTRISPGSKDTLTPKVKFYSEK